MNVREVLKILKKDGWYEFSIAGSHMHLKHNVKKGKVTVPVHNGDLAKGTLKSIFKQAGITEGI